MRNGVTSLSYSLRSDGEGGTFTVIDNLGDIVVTLDGAPVSSDNLELDLIEVTWLDDLNQTQTTVIASIEDFAQSEFVGGVFIDVTYDIVIAGAPLPITDLASFEAFQARVTSFGPVTTLGLLPGDDIVVADLPWDRSAAYFGVFGPVGEPGVIFGTEGNDQFEGIINGTAGDDDIRALGGDDWVQSSTGNDTIDGGFGTDVIFYDSRDLDGVFVNSTFASISRAFRGTSVTVAAQSVLKADGSTDSIQSIEAFHGSNSNDLIFLGGDAAYVFDRAGDDLVVADMFGRNINFAAGSGNDTYNGTLGGSDVISYGDDFADGTGVATEGVVVTMAPDGSSGTATDPWGDSDSFTNIERIVGSRFDDVISGSNQNNRLSGEDGNDILNGLDGRDSLLGGAGDDALNAGDNDGEGDYITPGTGNDTVTFDADVIGFFELDHRDLITGTSTGITLTVNGNANTGSITKGGLGTTTLNGVIHPILAGANDGGLSLIGSNQNDVFNVSSADNGWMSISGGFGDDSFVIGASEGAVRLDYVPSQAGGISANLASGVINAGAITGRDTITGPGRITELRATDSDDNIIGSAGNDSFILRQGNDTLDGGDGFDRLRYDRNGVSAILANLTTGVVTGGWFGEVFTHQISGIEHIRGSRDGNDQLIGDMGDNRLVAYMGDDTLDGGGGGDDTLEGGFGRDTFVLSGGVTTIVDFDPFSDRIQTNLPALSAEQIGQAFAAAAEDGSDVVVDFGGGSAVVFKDSFVDDIRAIVPSDGPFVPAPPPAPPAWTVGDPHLQTLDGVGYDFHAVGEFVLLRGTGDLTGRFEVQSRMAPVDGVPGVSVNEAVAIDLDGRVVMIDAADANPLWVDGAQVVLNDGGRLDLDNHLILRSGSTYTVYFAGLDDVLGDGDAQVIVDVRSGRLDIAVAASTEMAGAVEGLLGDGDGNAANDIARADGTVLERPLAFEDLYGGYRDDWRVTTDAQSLFVYDDGETLAGFYDPDAPGQTVAVDDFSPEQVNAAKDALDDAGLQPGTLAYDNALLDFLLTGDPDFIESSANPVIQNEEATPVQKLDAGQGRVALSVTLTDAKGVAVADARVGFVADGQTSAFLAQAGTTVGEYVVGLGEGSTGSVAVTKDYDPTGAQKINATDALAALRLGVGLNPSWGAADAFDFIQADVDRDGKVNANDALAILRIGLDLETEAEAGWVFFEEGTVFTGVTRNTVPQLGDLDLDAIDADASVDLVGILVGNVENLF